MSKKKEADLRKAALEGDVDLLQSIVAAGVNLEAPQPKDGQVALMYASANGYTDVMEILIKAGAKMQTQDKFGFTALHVAATTGEAEAIKLLLLSGANLDARDKFGNSALKKAREQKHAEAAKVLEDAANGILTQPSQSGALAASKRAAPDDGSEEEETKPPSKKGKEKAGVEDEPAVELAEVAQSVASHLARLREHARSAQAVLLSFAEAGGDPRALNLAPEDVALLAALRKVT